MLHTRLSQSINYAAKVVRRCILYPLTWIKRRLNGHTNFVGITGSAGKTTTKDLCATILTDFAPCQRTIMSSNEHFHVAQTVLGVRREHRYCVVELSASRPGYLDFALALLKPDIAVLTLVARDHFSAFKSIEAIAKEKGKVVTALSRNGIAVLNIDDPLVRDIGEKCKRRVIWIGRGEGATLRLHDARSNWPEPLTLVVEHEGTMHDVPTRLHGTQLALSVLASLGVALALEIPLARAIKALQRGEAAEGRMQLVQSDGITFVRDDWKAPLWSLPAPIEFMKQAEARRKVVIIGTLSDYSMSASKIYPKVARQALEVAELVVFVGPHSMRALKAGVSRSGQELLAFPSIRDASAALKTVLQAGDLVLLKGSNKADHLVRLILDRAAPIACWQEKCGLAAFCGRCKRLYKVIPHPVRQITADAPLQAMPQPAHAVSPFIAAGGAEGLRVIVGLGNPGLQYANTPHNVGYRVLESLVRSAGGTWQECAEGWVSFVELQGAPVALLKPGVSINRSGEPVRRFIDGASVSASRCLVVHDDMDLTLGDVRLKRSGGDAGHKGVRSLIAALGSGNFERVRVGVRRGGDVRRARELVLQDFTEAEKSVVGTSIDRAVALVLERNRSIEPVPHPGEA